MRHDTDTVASHCPYCGEAVTLVIDCSEPEQQYIEDCEVCCRPMIVTVCVPEEGPPEVWLCDENAAGGPP